MGLSEEQPGMSCTVSIGISLEVELLLAQQDIPLAWNGETLRVGSRGERVRLLQEYLNTVGSVWEIPQVPVTGYFGDSTRNAVRLFQDLFNLPPDGIVGRQTLGCADLAVSGCTYRTDAGPGSVSGQRIERGGLKKWNNGCHF